MNRAPIDPRDRVGCDDEERLAKREREDPAGGPRRFATRAEVARWIAELDAKWFPTAGPDGTEPNYARDRRKGAQGD